VMMPIIAHTLFGMMQVAIGAIRAFTQKCVLGIQANPEKAEQWLQQNSIVVTALNPLIGYQAGAALVKLALSRQETVKEVAIAQAKAGKLMHLRENRTVSVEEIEAALGNLRSLTEGGNLT
jgi:fumarate hydratase class II